MKFCMECGAQASDEQKFCRICGHKFPEMDQQVEGAGDETELVMEGFQDEEEAFTQGVEDTSGGGWAAAPGRAPEEDAAGDAGMYETELEPGEGSTVYVPPKELDMDGATQYAGEQEPEEWDDREGPGGEPGSKPLPLLWIGLAAVLVVCAGVGGWLLLRAPQSESGLQIAGQTYTVSQTDALTVEDPDEQDWENIAALTNLRSLTVVGDGARSTVTADQLELLGGLPDLTALELDGVQLEDPGQLDQLEDLEVLAVRNAGLDSSQCAGLPQLDHLTALDLAGNEIQDLAFLNKYPDLTELDLSGNEILDYTPLSACSNLRRLAVERCQAGVIGGLSALQELSVAGEQIEDVSGFVAQQKNTAELYQSMMEWFEEDDFDTIEVALKEYTTGNDVVYANGWLMDLGSDWADIRSALPQDAVRIVSDAKGVYCGQMKEDQRSGQGTQYLPQSNSWYRGSWSDDQPNGTGSYYKTLDDGRILEFSGTYANGYENGVMTMVVHQGDSVQSVAYSSNQGTRTTLQKLSDTQYVFASIDGTCWYDAQPAGHGVAMGGIAYQQEQSTAGDAPETEAQTQQTTGDSASSKSSGKSSSGSASSKSSGKSSSGSASSKAPGKSSAGSSSAAQTAPAQESAPAQTPAAPAPSTQQQTAPAIPDIAGQGDLQEMMQDAEAYAQQLLEGLE